jgi:type 1 glutamine amidotransferase
MKAFIWNILLTAAVLTFGAATAQRSLKAAESAAPSAGPRAFRVLVFSRTLGYRHASITNGIAALRELGRQNSFAVDATEDSSVFVRTNLARYAAVVFLSATGDVLSSDQEAALKSYVTGGGGFVGIHGAAFGPLACEEQWGWYGDTFCCAFKNHSAVVPGVIHVEDTGHPANFGLPERWARSEEWYNFTGTPRGCAHVLAILDESTYQGGTMGQDHPIIWCRQVGQGRMWYTAMGHTESSFDEPLFRQHLLSGILIAAARKPADFTPNSLTR